MAIQATIRIDGDRWAKHPYGVEFDDAECNEKFHDNWLDSREACYRIIQRAREAGYDIDVHVEEEIY